MKTSQRGLELIKEYAKEYRYKNKEKLYADFLEWKENNPERMKELRQKNYEKRKPNRKQERKKYQLVANARQKERYKNDVTFNIRRRLSASLHQSLKLAGVRKTRRTFELIGCSPQQLKEHLEKLFLPGMSWDKRSEIHVDHIIPIASFDLSNLEQQKKCFHYTNLQPLWAVDNIKKGAKIIQL